MKLSFFVFSSLRNTLTSPYVSQIINFKASFILSQSIESLIKAKEKIICIDNLLTEDKNFFLLNS